MKIRERIIIGDLLIPLVYIMTGLIWAYLIFLTVHSPVTVMFIYIAFAFIITAVIYQFIYYPLAVELDRLRRGRYGNKRKRFR